jgi:hypothetical protein
VSEAIPAPQELQQEPQQPNENFNQLISYLSDPHRSEVASQWEAVVQSKLGPEDRVKAESLAPVRLAATTVPTL